NLRALAEGRALAPQPLAEHEFARAAAVSIGGVEPPQPDPPRVIEQLQRLRFTVAGAAQARRRANPAEIAAAEHNPGDVTIGQHRATFVSQAEGLYAIAEILHPFAFRPVAARRCAASFHSSEVGKGATGMRAPNGAD